MSPMLTFGKRHGDNIFAGDTTHLPFLRNAGSESKAREALIGSYKSGTSSLDLGSSWPL